MKEDGQAGLRGGRRDWYITGGGEPKGGRKSLGKNPSPKRSLDYHQNCRKGLERGDKRLTEGLFFDAQVQEYIRIIERSSRRKGDNGETDPNYYGKTKRNME